MRDYWVVYTDLDGKMQHEKVYAATCVGAGLKFIEHHAELYASEIKSITEAPASMEGFGIPSGPPPTGPIKE